MCGTHILQVMSDYNKVKGGGLKLKKKQNLFKADKPKTKVKKEKTEDVDHDAVSRGGWWCIKEDFDLKGGMEIALEVGDGSRCYLAAMDNGKFTIGGPHREGEGPNPEEVFAVVKTPDDLKISMKTGYGKYIGVDSAGMLVATTEAIGARERFQPVFQDGKSALQSVANPLFLTMKPDKEGYIYVAAKAATEDEMINIRTEAERVGPVDHRPEDDRKKARECETSYVKKYQHSKVDLKGRHVSVDLTNKGEIRSAQNQGNLHEVLLYRRQKTKSDRYC